MILYYGFSFAHAIAILIIKLKKTTSVPYKKIPGDI